MIRRPAAHVLRAVLSVLALCAAALAASAAEYPVKPIHLIVPFATGGGADSIARAVAEGLQRGLKQPVLVENKPGGDSTIGSEFVAHAAADGYTVLFGTNTGMSAAPALRKSPGYDPLADFTPISLIGKFSYFVVVSNEMPVRTLPELIEHARANPGKLNYASGNAMGIVGTAQMIAAHKLDMVHVPYKGEAPALTDLITNRVQAMFVTGFIVPHVQAGKVRAIAAVTDARSPALPDVPTVIEEGVPEVSVRSWAGLFGPAGLPREVANRLAHEMVEVMKSPSVQEQLALQGFAGQASTPDELGALVQSQLVSWRRAVRDAGIKPE